MAHIISIPGAGGYGDPYDALPISDPLFDRGLDQRFPTTSNPDQILLDDGTVVCAAWCADAAGHGYAFEEADRVCRSPQLRLIPEQGGGRSAHHRPAWSHRDTSPECPAIESADATVTLLAEQVPGEPPAIVLATEVAGVDQQVTLSIHEADKVAADLMTLGMRIEGVRD